LNDPCAQRCGLSSIDVVISSSLNVATVVFKINGTACIVGLCNGTVSDLWPIRPLQQCAAGLLLWARLVGDIDRLLHNRQRNSTRPQHGAQQQMLVVPLFYS